MLPHIQAINSMTNWETSHKNITHYMWNIIVAVFYHALN